ncbi:MAG: hypothetical protein SVY10_07250, partial [Thermodesulfobacteriota bacterium]|nr:hypothetical protein [Thermodesulfobacteriota bacterium]
MGGFISMQVKTSLRKAVSVTAGFILLGLLGWSFIHAEDVLEDNYLNEFIGYLSETSEREGGSGKNNQNRWIRNRSGTMHEQWYAVDDVAIRTEYTDPDYMIGKDSDSEGEPVLHFCDIVSGPKSGNTDGMVNDHGAIVTIWGNNLGSSQGASNVYFKDSSDNIYEAAHVYYWVNADGLSSGGPADLHTYHKMQEIAFSIPFSASDGLGKIYATVNGVNSNELHFTVREGNIYFVKTTGNNSTGDGSWSTPWQTIDFIGEGAGGTLDAGDIIYVCDAVIE